MPRHYLKISKRLRPYAAKVATLEEDWRRTIFDDLTHGGRELRVVPVAANDQGPLIGLCGDTFFCHAGQDKHNAHSLFISRITPANLRPGKDAPTRIAGEFELITESDRHPDPRDPVHTLFAQVGAAALAETRVPSVAPGAELLRVLAVAEPGLRQRWAEGSAMGPDSELLPALKRLWSRYGLERFVEPEPRAMALLKGQIVPHQLTEADRRGLCAVFGVATLNAVARGSAQSTPYQEPLQQTLELVDELARLPLDSAVRAEIRAALTQAASGSDLGGEHSAVVSRWIMSQCEVTADDIERQAAAVAAAVAGWNPPEGPVTSAGDALAFVRELGELARQIHACVQAVPEPGDIERTKKHAETSFGRALRVFGDMAVELIDREPGLSADALVELADMAGSADELHALPPWLWGQSSRPRPTGTPRGTRAGTAEGTIDLAWCRALADDAVRARVHRARALLGGLDPTVRELAAGYPAPAAGEDADAHLERAVAELGRLGAVAQLHHAWIPSALGRSMAIAEILALADALDALGPRLGSETFAELVADMGRFLAGERGASAGAVSVRLAAYTSAIEQIEQFFGSARDATFGQLVRLIERHGSTAPASPAASDPASAGSGMSASNPASAGSGMSASNPASAGSGMSASNPASAGSGMSASPATAHAPASVATVPGSVQALAQAPVAPRRGSDTSLLRFDHNWVDDTGRRVPLVFVPHEDSERPYGVISVPLAVRTAEPGDMAFRLDIEVSSSLRESWPESWDVATPGSLRVTRWQWRVLGDEAVYTFGLEVPLRRPRTGKETVEITVRAVDEATGLPLSKAKRLRWNGIEVWEGDIPFAWPDTVRPQYVHDHPIGPQERYADIVQRLVSGGSFAVIAPRRFGKTTLVEYLYEHAQDWNLAIAPPVVCTGVMDERGLDYDAMWERVSAGLHSVLGVGLELGLGSGSRSTATGRTIVRTGVRTGARAGAALLPDEDAFARVREAAHQRGFKAVVVLFDEAQLLFPRKGGHRLGNAFKDRIERCWSRADASGQAPVVFGFTGLPGLRERAGANFMGILRPYEERHIEERALNRLILQITRGRLCTTREARQRLAAQSGNLYILKTLLDRLIRQVNRERRTWAAYQDVLVVEAELRAELERGADHNLTQYMRDPLNASEDINVWEPRSCYPVAVALALHSDAVSGMVSGEARLDALVSTLDAWSRAMRDDTGPALVFTPGRVEEHLATLREIGVWTGERLSSAIMRSWLIGVARDFPRTESDVQALARAALERIRVPSDIELVDGSDTGTLYRFERGDMAYALRKVALAGPVQKQRFIERARALQHIQERQHLGEAGAEYVYKLQAVGLAESEELGVEIYQWIDGESLGHMARQLDAVVVADLANKLAMALRFLHSYEVVHEGISPGNIIVERESMRPILIDFGVARASDDFSDPASRPGMEHLWPPEVRAGGPWTSAGDIYALGATLEHVWSQSSARPEEIEPLAELISACKREQPHARIDAEELVRRSDRLNEKLKVYQRQEQAWYTLQEAAGADLDKRWFRELMEKFRPKFVAIMSGLHTDLFERSRDIALFLDQVLEAHPASHTVLNLGRVKHKNEDTDTMLVAPSIELLHALRLNAAHFRQGLPRHKLVQTYGIDDDDRLRQLILEGARLIARFSSLSSLPHVAEIVLSAE